MVTVVGVHKLNASRKLRFNRGGPGKRFSSLTERIPKPLVKVNN